MRRGRTTRFATPVAPPVHTHAARKPAHGQHHSRDAQHHQDLPRRQGPPGRVDLDRGGIGPRDLRRERRRQVDADEGALGRLPARHLRRRDPAARRAGRVPIDQRLRGRRHRHHPPGAGALARTCRSPRTSTSATRSSAAASSTGTRPTSRRASCCKKVGLRDNPITKIVDIGVGKQQLVEIAKALSKEVKILILDEPTAALNDDDSAHLLDLIRQLKEQGITSIIISHKLNEIKAIADRVTIIRDGRTIETLEMNERGREREPHHQGDGGPGCREPLPRSRAASSARSCCASSTGPCTTRSTAAARSSTTPTSRCAPARSWASPD